MFGFCAARPDASHVSRRSRLALAGLAVIAWQIASASASAAWSEAGGASQAQQRADHPLDLVLARAAPLPQTASFTACGV